MFWGSQHTPVLLHFELCAISHSLPVSMKDGNLFFADNFLLSFVHCLQYIIQYHGTVSKMILDVKLLYNKMNKWLPYKTFFIQLSKLTVHMVF